MKDILILHNPHCSKSRETLSLLLSKGIEPQIIDYLNGELSKSLLEKIIEALQIHPKEILRTKEEEFQKLELDLNDDIRIIEAILQHPIILERPIVLKGNRAAIGRPPENILSLLKF